MLSHLGKLNVQSGYCASWRMLLRDFGLELRLLLQLLLGAILREQ